MPRKKTDRCTGHCCQALSLPLSPDELRSSYHRWLGSLQKGSTNAIQMSSEGAVHTIYSDIHLIAPMLEYIGHLPETARRVNPTDRALLEEKPELRHVYRCKLYDAKTGNCTIYEIRPQMCRDYPYSKTCDYAQCGWLSRKTKKETPTERRARRKALKAERDDPGGGDLIKAPRA